jgi:two-component system LytT family response regulator
MKADAKIRAVISDDEALSRVRIRNLLKHHPEVEVIAECADGLQTVDAVIKNKPDLLFLDIQMPGLTGFQALKKLQPNQMPLVIFVSAYDQYTLKAFEVHALDYILKPFKRKRFEESLTWAKMQLSQNSSENITMRALSILDELERTKNYVDRFAVKTNGRVSLIRAEEVDWIQAEDNYIRIHQRKESFLIRYKIGSIEEKLNPRQFIRIHRGAIVNIDRIQELQQVFHRDYQVILQDGTKLPLGRNYRQKLREVLGNQF